MNRNSSLPLVLQTNLAIPSVDVPRKSEVLVPSRNDTANKKLLTITDRTKRSGYAPGLERQSLA